jgi:hypothetical protein
MTSYQILTKITAEDIICKLISMGYGNEDLILKKPLHILISRYKWFVANEEEKLKMYRSMCPLYLNKSK